MQRDTPISLDAQGAVAPLLGLQSLLRRCSTASDRKRLILTAWECGALDLHATGLLVTSNQLETA